MTIGQLASDAGVGVETVRFYERRGLLPRPARNGSGYRQYTQDAARRMNRRRRAKELGFSLKEIGELLAMRLDRGISCAEVKERSEAKIADIEAKIQSLRAMKKALAKLNRRCSGRGPTSECPILDAFACGDGPCCDATETGGES